MASPAPYDEIADRYEDEFHAFLGSAGAELGHA